MQSNYFLKKVLLLFVFLCSLNSYAQNCSAYAGIDQVICVTQPLILSGVAGNPQAAIPVYLWTQVSGPQSTINSPTSLTTTVTGFTPGNYVFKFSNKCADGFYFTNLVSISVSPSPPSALAGNDTAICSAASIPLSANSVTAPFTGTWTVSPNTGTFLPDKNTANASYTPVAGANIYTLTWTISNGNCTTSSSKIIKIITPPAISAGPNQTISCTGNCTTLAGSNTGISPPQTGIWSQVSGPATPVVYSNINSPTSTICNLVVGTYVFRWSVTGPCLTNAATVSVVVNNVYTNPLGSDYVQYFTYCNTPLVSSQVLSGSSLANGESGSWYQTAGGTPPYPNVNYVPNNTGSSVLITGMTGNFPYVFKYVKSNASGCTINGTHTVFRNPPLTNLTIPPNQDLDCNVQATTFNISYDDVNMIENGLSRISNLLIAPVGTNSFKAIFTSSSNPAPAGTGTRTDLWTVTGMTTAGTYFIRMEYRNSCGTQFRDIKITVSKTPGTINIGNNLILPCNQLSANPIAFANAPGSLAWSQISGPNTATLSGINNTSLSMSGLDNGVYKMRLTNSGGTNCTAVTADLLVYVLRIAPTITTIGPNATICNGRYQLTADIPKANETGAWAVSPSANIIFSPNNSAPNAYVSGLAANTNYTFTWTVTNTCGSTSKNQILTTNSIAASPLPDAGADICRPSGSTTAALNGNAPGASVILWTALTAGSSVSSSTSQATTANFTGGSGVFFFKYELSTAGCSTFFDTVAVTINAVIPPVNAGTNQNICTAALPANTTLNATPIAPAGTTALWTQLSGPTLSTIVNPTSASTAISNMAKGIYEFEYRIHSGNCSDVSDTVVVRVAQDPTDAVAGPDQSICNATTATLITLGATPATVGNGYWDYISGPPGSSTPIFGYSKSPATTVSGLSQGTYILKWTTYNDPSCPSKTSNLTLNINAASSVSSNISVCDKATIELKGSPNTQGTWGLVSGSSGTTITANSNNNAIVSGLISNPTGNQYIFSYTIPPVNGCASTTSNMTISNFAAPVLVDAGPDQLLCADINTVTMIGNAQTAGTGLWVLKSGPNLPTAGSGNVNYQDTTLNNIAAGIYVYQYTINNNAVCAGASDLIQIIKESKALVSPSSQRFCNVSTINLTGNLPFTHIGTWSIVSGSAGSVFTNINDPTTTVTGLVPGTYIFRWTIGGDAGCPINSSDVQIIIDPPVPLLNAGPDYAFCEGSIPDFTLGNTPVNGLTYLWSPATLLSNTNSAQPTFSGVNNAGNYTYTLEASNGSCKAYDAVTITVLPKPGANINITGTTCSVSFLATDVGIGVKTPINYDWLFGTYPSAIPATSNGAGPIDVVFANGGNKNIQLSVTSADGCTNSQMQIYQPACPLPITLLSFTATYRQSNAELNWLVTEVINFKKFEIERSFDGIQFTTLHVINYLNNVYAYSFRDNQITMNTGTLFYRLKLIDIDGVYKYSDIRTVTPYPKNIFSISPDPFSDKIKISFKSYDAPKKIQIRILNITSKVVKIKELMLPAGQHIIEMYDLDKIVAGTYILQFITIESFENFKIIKL